jgi:hypothetical protein
MSRTASDIYFDLFDKTSSLWEGSSEDFDKIARGGAVRSYLGGLLQRAGGRTGNIGTKLTQHGNRAGGEMVLHPRTQEAVHFNRLGKLDQQEVLRNQVNQYTDDLAKAKAKLKPKPETKVDTQTPTKGLGEKVVAPTEAATPRNRLRSLLIGGGLAAAGGAGAYQLGRVSGEEGASNNRNLAFGGGLAAGLAAPHVLTGINRIVANQGLLPSGQYSPSNFQRI